MKIMSMKRHVVVAETMEDIRALAETAGLTAEEWTGDHIFISDDDEDTSTPVAVSLGRDALVVEPNAGETVWYVIINSVGKKKCRPLIVQQAMDDAYEDLVPTN